MARSNRKKIPWNEVKEKYITSETITFEEVAKEFGIAPSTIMNRAAKEKWTTSRERYHEIVSRKAQDLAGSSEARRRAKMLTIADSMKGLAAEGLSRAIQDFSKNKDSRMDLAEIRLMIKDGTEIERRALGMADVLVMTDDELDAKILSLAARLAEGEEEGVLN
jgi:hypothetical protein